MVSVVPRRKIERITSLNDIRNPNSAALTIPGIRIGNSMSQNTRQLLAPRSRPASTRQWSKRSVTTRMISSAKGNAQTKCPSATDQNPSFSPSTARVKIRSAAPIDMPGTKSGITNRNSILPGLASEGAARPMIVAATAQTSPTITPMTRLATIGMCHSELANSAR